MIPYSPTDPVENALCVLGIPLDHNSSFKRGAAQAPDRIRQCYASDSSNLWTETGIDLGQLDCLHDAGNVEWASRETAFSAVTSKAKTLLAQNNRLISLGGDHSVTYPIVRAVAKVHPNLNILHLDAHPDLYDNLDNNPHSHASPFARIMEQGYARRLVQAGIRTMNSHQRKQAERFKVEVHEMKDGLEGLSALRFDGPVYLSIDLDCLDPAFAPGVSHHEPGGMTTRQVLDLLHTLDGKIIGGDIVEYNPDRDFISVTGMVAAKFLKEMIGRVYADRQANS
ncbi:MAG TPA: agmatinase [Desulfobacteraceae bacterium]|nr:agmatinase [Desulfobacteraceae bacterium]